MNPCIVYLASRLDDYNSTLSTGESRFEMTCCSLKNVTNVLKLPVIMFHEDFTNKEKKIMRDVYGNITFEKVDFVRSDLPFNQKPCITSGKADGSCSCVNPHIKNPKDVCFRPKGYLMMCRFFSGHVQNHPALKKYDAYLRFDDDSFLIKPFLDQNTFLKQLYTNDYVFRSIYFERNDHSNLLDFTKKFCKENNLNFYQYENELKKSGFLKPDGSYSGLSPYTNFHFSKLSLWKHPIVKKYIDEIDKINGCLIYNWYDTPIQSIICFILCPLIGKSFKAITNFGYRHNRHFSALNNTNLYYRKNERFFPLE